MAHKIEKLGGEFVCQDEWSAIVDLKRKVNLLIEAYNTLTPKDEPREENDRVLASVMDGLPREEVKYCQCEKPQPIYDIFHRERNEGCGNCGLPLPPTPSTEVREDWDGTLSMFNGFAKMSGDDKKKARKYIRSLLLAAKQEGYAQGQLDLTYKLTKQAKTAYKD